MARLFVSGAMLAIMLGGADAHVRFAADYSVQPYLDNRSLGVGHGPPVNIPPRPAYRAPAEQNGQTVRAGGTIQFTGHGFAHEESVTVTLDGQIITTAHTDAGGTFTTKAVPAPGKPGTYVYRLTGAAGDSATSTITVANGPLRPPVLPSPTIPTLHHELASPPPQPVRQPAVTAPAAPDGFSSTLLFLILLFFLGGGCLLMATAKRPSARVRTPGTGVRESVPCVVPMRAAGDSGRRPSKAASPDFPSQDGWARRAGTVRNPVSGFVFRFQARANARALDEERQRMKSAREMTKEYTGMLNDLAEGEEAATAYAVRRELAGDFYEHELLKQQEQFEEASHKRRLSGKRREKELTEADTRRIEAAHEQEAVERFKEPKFAAGLARFEEKQKGYLVGSASAEAAIAETKTAARPESGANESAEVLQLYALLQSTMAAIEEGERVGRDTQALRERRDMYKKLLNLS
jgi:hypothetical protein